MTAVRIAVLGTPGAGRTTFIRTISEIMVLSTDLPDDDGDDVPGAAEDVGRITVDRDLVLHLVSSGAAVRVGGPAVLGHVVLVDGSRPDRLPAAAALLADVRAGGAPYVVVVRADDDLAAVRDGLGLEEQHPVLRCDARDRAAVKRVLLALLQAAAAALAA